MRKNKFYLTFLLEELREEQADISSGWNGKDEKFTVNGDTYTEEDAHQAEEIVDRCIELLKLLGEE